jgi:hypothetical protein
VGMELKGRVREWVWREGEGNGACRLAKASSFCMWRRRGSEIIQTDGGRDGDGDRPKVARRVSTRRVEGGSEAVR